MDGSRKRIKATALSLRDHRKYGLAVGDWAGSCREALQFQK
jgi:hypothetical protein